MVNISYNSLLFASYSRANLATVSNAWSTFMVSLALVSKWGKFPLSLHHSFNFKSETCLLCERSILFPNTTNGNSVTSGGFELPRNSSLCEPRIKMVHFIQIMSIETSSCPSVQKILRLWYRSRGHNSLLPYKMLALGTETFLALQCPISDLMCMLRKLGILNLRISVSLTWRVTSLSSIVNSFERKSAPIVALYWLLNFRWTYCPIKDVFPTLYSQQLRFTLCKIRPRILALWLASN